MSYYFLHISNYSGFAILFFLLLNDPIIVHLLNPLVDLRARPNRPRRQWCGPMQNWIDMKKKGTHTETTVTTL